MCPHHGRTRGTTPRRRRSGVASATGHERIRVAYVSADFHAHATAALMAGVWEQHDLKPFCETIAVSFGRDDGKRTCGPASPARSTASWMCERPKRPGNRASLIRQLEVDIAVDLKGYTLRSSLGNFCPPRRTRAGELSRFSRHDGRAPTSITFVADPVVNSSRNIRGFYTEQIAYLPDTYQCNDFPARGDGLGSLAPHSAGLPGKRSSSSVASTTASRSRPRCSTSGCASCVKSLTASLVAAGGQSRMRRVICASKRKRAAIAPERLVFAPRVTAADHLARHKLADSVPRHHALWRAYDGKRCAVGGAAGCHNARAPPLPRVWPAAFAPRRGNAGN
jgi:predicted O-linked N-acetylglucosamine transferase (SPINDLY family)